MITAQGFCVWLFIQITFAGSIFTALHLDKKKAEGPDMHFAVGMLVGFIFPVLAILITLYECISENKS